MRQIFIILCLTLFASGVIKAQVGLQNVTIETYYVVNATDVAYVDPLGADPIPAGAVTYRMYVDLAPGWDLQAIYGVTNVGTGEVDTMVFRSTAPFWNHSVLGKLYGYQTNVNDLSKHLIALDSWLSTGRSSGAGAAGLAASRSCVLETGPSEDTNGGAPVHPHAQVTLLTHNDASAGLPLTTEDGNIPYPVAPFPGVVTWTETPGIAALLEPLNAVNDPATEIVVTDGALGVTQHLLGPNGSNRICIGQFTTTGIFSGQINLQIRDTSTLVVENYVAETPGPGEFTHSSLTWGPNALPTVTITLPVDGADFPAGATVNIAATATDSDGSIDQVEFFKDGVSIGIDATGPSYTASFIAGTVTETVLIEAVATDNQGGEATDAINVDILGNNPPVVNLTAPLTAITGSTVNVSATATDLDGITQVEFFFNGGSIGVDIAPPYEASFTATPAGVRLIKAIATDGLGAPGEDSQNITITNNVAPTVTITDPDAGDYIPEGPTNVIASANDSDGSVAQVEFFANGVSIGVDNTGPSYQVSWNAVFVGPAGAVSLTAVVTDNLGLTGNSAAVPVNVINPLGSPYVVESVEQECNDNTVCMPISAITAIDDVIGFDMVLTWDNTQIFPTGNIIKSGELLDADLFETDYSIDFLDEEMLISVFLDVDAPFGTSFEGTGELVCVEFAKRLAFHPVDSTNVEITSFQESYFSEVVDQDPVPPGEFKTFRNTVMTSNLVFWEDDSPLYYDGSNLVVTIQANNSSDCGAASAAGPGALVGPIVNPDATGYFDFDLSNGLKISIGKDIAPTTDVLELINGFDALLTRRTLVDDPSFTPSIFQAIAMDVNRDGVISAGDVSQINQRAILILDEFRQAWNYNSDGTPKATYSPSKDWQFVEFSTALFNPQFQISTSFPQDNGVGYSKHRVPQVPFCVTTPVSHFATCPQIGEEKYIGIMYGDINGNFGNTIDLLLRGSYAVNVGVGQAQYNENYVDVPVTFKSPEDVNSIDLSMDFDATKLAYHSLVSSNIQAVGHFNENDGKLRITSNSLVNLTEGETAFMIRFTKLTDKDINVQDFNTGVGYLNGDKVNLNFVAPGNGTQTDEEVIFNVTPNPTSNFLYIGISKDVTAEIVDLNGKVVMSDIQVAANNKQRVDVSHLPVGLYIVRVYSDHYTSTQRVLIGK